MNKLVSIIIPTYGPPVRLKDAINSVFLQDYSPIELIIVDDNGKGSKYQKEVQEIVSKFMKDRITIKYVCHDVNKNGAVARNTGIRIAQGEYIALLDDDDIFLPKKITLQVEKMNLLNNVYKACYTSFYIIFPDGRKKRVISKPPKDIALDIMNFSSEIPSSTLMFTKSAWNYIGGFDESFKRHQDWEFTIRLAQICDFVNVEEICVKRIITKRNSPENAVIYQKYREHFLEKMQPIIKSYPKKIQREIECKHYMDITFQYFKNKKIMVGAMRLIKYERPISGLFYIIKRLCKYLISKILC